MKGGYDMGNWFWFLLGMLVWQLIGTVAFVVSGEKEGVAIYFGIGVVGVFISLIVKGIRWLLKVYINHCYITVAIRREVKKDAYGLMGMIGTIRIKSKDLPTFYQKGENEHYLEVINNKKQTYRYPKANKIRTNGWYNQKWFDENLRK